MSAPTVQRTDEDDETTEQYHSDLVEVLAGASIIATHFWESEAFDIYECMKRSWSVRGRSVAMASVLRATRQVLPGGDLYAYNDAPGRTAADISAVFGKATARVLGGLQQRPHARSVSLTGGGAR
ncbi:MULTISPECIES: DUF6197 family protein [Mycolicibacter]|uniref:Uncharacterized protein n=2 Tax=Mycolicibacter TaxID=1073531 RepID=A0ABU5XNW0_9MYCO|nr:MULTISPECIES: hypothetical protein [unclassified Mycolicibacter]MEB3023457.1 hypothetical protein [Mycolicibacter sp. MYC098]MEB3033800.1 hypothetical protein [Mycolicibacter sp. MYC340]